MSPSNTAQNGPATNRPKSSTLIPERGICLFSASSGIHTQWRRRMTGQGGPCCSGPPRRPGCPEDSPIPELELWLDLPSRRGPIQQGIHDPPGALGISYDMDLDAVDIQMHQ